MISVALVGTDTSGIAKMLRSEEQLPSVSSETFYEPHFSMHKSKSNEEKKALATPGKSTSGGFGGKTKTNSVLNRLRNIITSHVAGGRRVQVPLRNCTGFNSENIQLLVTVGLVFIYNY